MAVRRLDHVGVVVEDLDAGLAFFLALGLECAGSTTVEGEWVDRVVGLEDVRSEVIYLRTSGGDAGLELIRYSSPRDDSAPELAAANRLGIRHVAFAVDDMDGVIERLRGAGFTNVGEVVDYEDSFRLCYVRGPEGIIVELAQHLGA